MEGLGDLSKYSYKKSKSIVKPDAAGEVDQDVPRVCGILNGSNHRNDCHDLSEKNLTVPLAQVLPEAP
jgi:hypothetical protein